MFKDSRSKKVALIANCILNQNAKVAPMAAFPAMVPNVLEVFERNGYGIHQLPCPETYGFGLRRFWAKYEQYNQPGIRRAFVKAAEFTFDCVEDFLANGFTVVLIGADGSPSCGVNVTDKDDNNTWLGEPKLPDSELDAETYAFNDAQGVFIEVLQEEVVKRGYPKLPVFGLNCDMFDAPLDIVGLEKFLQSVG